MFVTISYAIITYCWPIFTPFLRFKIIGQLTISLRGWSDWSLSAFFTITLLYLVVELDVLVQKIKHSYKIGADLR